MAGDYIIDNPATPARFEKILKIFIIFACLCLTGELIWLLGIGPFRQFSRIDISGAVSREEILAVAGINESSSFFSTDAKAVEKALMSISTVQSAKVFKYFPGRLQIIIENRRPLASALASLNGETVMVLFDSQGVIIEVGAAILPVLYPLVSGLLMENPYPGMRLPAFFVPFFGDLQIITDSAPELLNAISEIKIVRKPFDVFELVLYPVHNRIKVRLSELNEDMLRYALLMVDVLSSRDDGIDTLDFRSGIASYIPMEEYTE